MNMQWMHQRDTATEAEGANTALYTTYCRPGTGKKLTAANLDKQYHRGAGEFLYYRDVAGREVEIADFVGGYGAALFGHSPSPLVHVATTTLQSGAPFVAQGSCRAAAARLCARLDRAVGTSTGRQYVTTLANSGAEAVEVAIKHAELYRQQRLARFVERQRAHLLRLLSADHDDPACIDALGTALGIDEASPSQVRTVLESELAAVLQLPAVLLALRGAFHGKTCGAVQLTHNPELREPFSQLGPQVCFLDPGDDPAEQVASLSQQVRLLVERNGQLTVESTAVSPVTALFLEPIQGEAGVVPITGTFAEACRSVATELDFPLVIDEIQTGMGRTGTFLASERLGVRADCYLLGKSLGGGLAKIAACMVDRQHYIDEFSMLHTSTFAEDEFSSNIALAALDLLDSDAVAATCAEKGARIESRLREVQQQFPSIIADLRGRGLMLGIEFHPPTKSPSDLMRGLAHQELLGYAFAAYLLNRHDVRVLPSLSASLTLRIQPGYLVGDSAIERLVDGIAALADIIARGDFYALTSHLVGVRFQPGQREAPRHRAPVAECARQEIRRVGFVAHFIEPEHVRLRDHSLKTLSRAQCGDYLDRVIGVLGPACYEKAVIRSETGDRVGFTFVGMPQTSRHFADSMVSRDLAPIRQLVQTGVDLAAREECQVVGLGGFTSIATNNCRSLLPGAVALTSGNSLTVAMALEAMKDAAGRRRLEIADARLATLGASGNIGRVFCELAADEVAAITLIGRPGSASTKALDRLAELLCERALEHVRIRDPAQLTGVARTIARQMGWSGQMPVEPPAAADVLATLQRSHGSQAAITVSDLRSGLAGADLVLGASSSPDPVITTDLLPARDMVICDISTPPDTHPDVASLDNVTAIGGGLVALPCNRDFSIGGVALEPGVVYACMAETMLLGLAGIDEHYSYGPIEIDKVHRIAGLASLHGFRLARGKDLWGARLE